MRQFTRIQTTAILATILVICALSVPNFVSDETIAGWPEWAQRRMTLAPELQGGTSLVLEVDQSRVRRYVLNDLFYEVRNILRDVRIGSAPALAIRNDSVEVRPRAVDFGVALAKLGELSQAFNGVRAADVADAGGGLIRVTPTEAHIREYERPTTNRSIGDVRARLFGVPARVERDGPWRVKVLMPGPPEALSRPIQ
jgi:preprotein translocase subunit SecD